jgi:hypothetical protein
VAFKLDQQLPRKVSIIPEGDTLGMVMRKPWPSWFDPDIEITPRNRLLIENRTITLLAGQEAERRFGGRSNARGAASDNTHAAGLAILIGDDGEGASAFIRWCSFRTQRLVLSCWGSITKFAEQLLEKGELKGSELRDALDEACLRPGMTLEQAKALRISPANSETAAGTKVYSSRTRRS